MGYEKDRFRCLHGAFKVGNRFGKKRDLNFLGREFVRLAVLEFVRFQWSRVNASRNRAKIRPVSCERGLNLSTFVMHVYHGKTSPCTISRWRVSNIEHRSDDTYAAL